MKYWTVDSSYTDSRVVFFKDIKHKKHCKRRHRSMNGYRPHHEPFECSQNDTTMRLYRDADICSYTSILVTINTPDVDDGGEKGEDDGGEKGENERSVQIRTGSGGLTYSVTREPHTYHFDGKAKKK